ncbi:MAG: ABC transporter permease [Chloroflexi bacterium]|nr:ABC transporter permease [Chloroflexota bacterium]
MSVIWRKVWRDLWHNKLRTLLVVLATTTGVFSIGMIFGLSAVMTVRLAEDYQASVPPHLSFDTGLFDKSLVETIRREPGVAVAQGEARTSFRWKLEGETDWRPGEIFARDDYEAQSLYLIDLMDGNWPAKRTLAVERLSSSYFDLPIGTSILVDVGQRQYSLPIEGIVRHPHTEPPQIGEGDAAFCVTLETFAWLTNQAQGFDSLQVRTESFSQEAAREIGDRIDDRLENAGVQARQEETEGEEHGESASGAASVWSIIDPDVHWGQEIIDTTTLILAILGVLSLGLSGFLIVNTMNATVVQQVWQIGVMKVIGASAGRVARVYLATALVYGLFSLLVAVPLGAVVANFMAAWLLDLFNVILGDFRLMPEAVVLQVVAGVGVPLLAALVAVVGGARITVREAISSHGLGGKFGSGWLDQLIGRIRRLPRPMALSLRNTFRRKARVALTLFALAGGGVMFIMVMGVSVSFNHTLDVLLSDFGFDTMVILDRPYSAARLIEASESVPGVRRAEVWNRGGAQIVLPNGEDLGVGLWAVPPDTEMFHPRIVSGRNLLPEEGNALLLNNKIAIDEGFQVGDEIELVIDGRKATWTVVGLAVNIAGGSRDNFVPFDALARATGGAERGGRVLVTFDTQTPEVQQKLTEDLRNVYEARRIKTTQIESASEIRERNITEFNIILYLLLVMAGLGIVVGSAGLMSTMSISVVERAREIGMMRAIGATSLGIVGIFVVEGMVIGLLSWLLSVPISYPGARIFSDLVGGRIVDIPLDFTYPVNVTVFWLVIVVVVSALASLWPALQATKISVREALAYE